MDTQQTPFEMLQSLVGEIVALDHEDLSSVASFATQLESVIQNLSGQSSTASSLLTQAVSQLQVVVSGGASDAQSALDAVAGAITEAAEHLGSETPAATAVQAPTDEPPALLPADTDVELLGEYTAESLDHIVSAEAALLELENNPTNAEPINTVFRAFHTIKGTSGFLALGPIGDLAHWAESLLDRARTGEIQIHGVYADLALKSCDMLRGMIAALPEIAPGEPLVIPANYDILLAELEDPEAVLAAAPEPEPARLGDILVAKGQIERDTVEEVAKDQGDDPIGKTLIDAQAVSTADVVGALRTQKRMSGAATEGTVRVGTDRLDSLVNMIGELVIAQSMVAQDAPAAQGVGQRLIRNVTHAGKIIRELQDLTMALRMVPLKGSFQKMLRLVRDLAKSTGKEARLIVDGEDTEIDRNMVEVIGDPLVHLMRNAVDHGLEAADRRAAAGKDLVGTLRLKAYHSAGSVVIELQDDGQGLDRDAIVAKAVQQGLIDADRDLSDSEVYGLIFQPGFSTAQTVTDVSGRGVGMDVVKRSIESLRGRIEVRSTPGKGATFTIRLPLTMAIADAMLVRVGEERFLLPTISIERSFRPAEGDVSTVGQRGETVMVRDELLPVFRLHTLFNVDGAVTDVHDALLIIVDGEGARFALMVDELLDQRQVVIKSLGDSLGHLTGVTGGAILGDGRVGLILDPGGLLEIAHTTVPDVQAA